MSIKSNVPLDNHCYQYAGKCNQLSSRRQAKEIKRPVFVLQWLPSSDMSFIACHINCHYPPRCWRRFPSICLQTVVCHNYSPLLCVSAFQKGFSLFSWLPEPLTDFAFHLRFKIGDPLAKILFPSNCFYSLWQFFIRALDLCWPRSSEFGFHVHFMNSSHAITADRFWHPLPVYNWKRACGTPQRRVERHFCFLLIFSLPVC